MMILWERFVDFVIDQLIVFFLPLVCLYFAFTGNIFLNVAAEDASGLEKAGDTLLMPYQYVFGGRVAQHLNPLAADPDLEWDFVPRFSYTEQFWPKAAASFVTLPPALLLGMACKGAAYLATDYRQRYDSMKASLDSSVVRPHLEEYEMIGIQLGDMETAEYAACQGHLRRPGDEHYMKHEKEALKEITRLLNEADIPWWVDCGTCLGAFRYGGAIPWDFDIDIAVLLPDFDNVWHVLNRLDPKKYIVQDWSGRDFPKSYLKVYIRETRTLIDIYHFDIDWEKGEIDYLFSMEDNLFMPEWWKIRERRFKVPVAIEDVFPLKKTMFDGVEVFMPNNTEKYLQRYYGENLDPAKVYDPASGRYEKDLTHPYWQRAYVH